MRRYGLFTFLGRGHLDPGLAIGRGLKRRGHHVTVFHLTLAQAAVHAAGLGFAPLDDDERTAGSPMHAGRSRHRPWLSTIEILTVHAARTLMHAPAALRAARIDAVIADQLDVAAGTVAEALGLPFVNLSCGPPVYLDESVPPPYFGWPEAIGAPARARNRRGNAFMERRVRPLLDRLNIQRRAWKLTPIDGINQLFSTRGIITQLPASLELPRTLPRQLFYTGQFRDDEAAARVRFEWDRLDGRPLVYASMGTVRNTSASMFRTIAEACQGLGVQLVLSLGGGLLRPADLGPLPGDPIVVHYAPQRALLDRACLTINCAGMNTTLDALRRGVPIVAIPVAEDQPGVAARIARAGVGVVAPAETLTVARLHQAIATVLRNPRTRDAARLVQGQLARIDGREQAIDLIEQLVTGSPSVAHRQGHDALDGASARA
jgi:MGT family glycosyltransferase